MPRDARPSDGCTSDSCRNSRAGRGLADLVVILTFKILSIFTLKIQSIFTLKILSIFTLKILSIFTLKSHKTLRNFSCIFFVKLLQQSLVRTNQKLPFTQLGVQSVRGNGCCKQLHRNFQSFLMFSKKYSSSKALQLPTTKL